MPKHVINNELIDKPWSEIVNKKAQYDCMTKNLITYALNLGEFFKIS